MSMIQTIMCFLAWALSTMIDVEDQFSMIQLTLLCKNWKTSLRSCSCVYEIAKKATPIVQNYNIVVDTATNIALIVELQQEMYWIEII